MRSALGFPEKAIGSLGVQPPPRSTSLRDLGQDLPFRGLSFLAGKSDEWGGASQETPGSRAGSRKTHARVSWVSPRGPQRPSLGLGLAEQVGGLRVGGAAPRSAAKQDPLPHTLPGAGFGRGGTALPEPRPPPPPGSRAPPRPRLRLRARRPPPPCALRHSAAPRTSERPAGPWGRPRVGSRSRGARGEPARPRSNGPDLPASRPWAVAAPPCALRNPWYARRGPRGRRAAEDRRAARD